MQHAVPGVGMVEHGTKMTGRWIEIVDLPAPDPEPQEEDTRTAREITDGIWARMRGGDRR